MDELLDFIKNSENDKLRKRLEYDPSLADTTTEKGITLLQFAAYCRNVEAIELLKSAKSHWNAFEAAATGESPILLSLLDEEPGLIKKHSGDGFTILGLATFFQHQVLVEELLARGADPNIPANNPAQVTPLHSACAVSNLDIARLLLENGADPNAKQMRGGTPLHSAAHNGQTELVRLLLKHGANSNAQMDNGQMPLDMAREGGFTETEAVLRQQVS
jgi:uncharacterized protein